MRWSTQVRFLSWTILCKKFIFKLYMIYLFKQNLQKLTNWTNVIFYGVTSQTIFPLYQKMKIFIWICSSVIEEIQYPHTQISGTMHVLCRGNMLFISGSKYLSLIYKKFNIILQTNSWWRYWLWSRSLWKFST